MLKPKVVVGLGKTGLSCVRYLMKKNQPVAVTDSRLNPPNLDELQKHFPTVPTYLGQFNAELCQNADTLIVSPGVALREPAIQGAIQKGVSAIGDIELFFQQARAPIVAITGSNGKSTVTTLVGEMARAAHLDVGIGGNLGTPALDLLKEKESALYVLELSSFQLETTYSLKAKAAVILNISEDHMDRYDSLKDYLGAKQRIYQNCEYAIVNRDDPATWENLEYLDTQKVISFGFNPPSAQQFGLQKTELGEFLAFGDELLIKTDELKIKGRHQIANALAALALGYAAGLPFAAMITTLRHFTGLAHRCQWIGQQNGVDWYNDSKATNVGAAQAAIEGLGASVKGKLIVLGGGLGKNADFTVLKNAMQRYVRTLILFGQDAGKMEAALASSTSVLRAADLANATSLAKQQAQPGDAVILAPACASWDMFRDFEHRGEEFVKLVRTLLNESSFTR